MAAHGASGRTIELDAYITTFFQVFIVPTLLGFFLHCFMWVLQYVNLEVCTFQLFAKIHQSISYVSEQAWFSLQFENKEVFSLHANSGAAS